MKKFIVGAALAAQFMVGAMDVRDGRFSESLGSLVRSSSMPVGFHAKDLQIDEQNEESDRLFHLALAFLSGGEGLESNVEGTAALLRQACIENEENARAYYLLAKLLFSGLVQQQCPGEGSICLARASAYHSSNAAYEFATIILFGDCGVQQDVEKAVSYFQTALTEGCEEALPFLIDISDASKRNQLEEYLQTAAASRTSDARLDALRLLAALGTPEAHRTLLQLGYDAFWQR